MGTDGTTPDGAAAAQAAGVAAESAAQSAAVATDAADTAMKAAATAAVSVALVEALVPIHAALDELRKATGVLTSDEVADDATVTNLQKILLSSQSQALWINAAMLLIGAAIGYVLTALVFG